MMRLRLFGCAVLSLHASVGVAQQLPRVEPEVAGLSRAALQKIDDQLERWVDSGKVAGIVAVISRNGKVAYWSSAGSLDSARQAPIAPDAVYRIFSMSKPIATTAIMQLVERGRIKLNDPVSKYIPAFAKTKVYAGGGATRPDLKNPARPITIAHLLTHTAGLTYGAFGNTPVDSIYTRSNLMDPHLTLAVFAESVAHLPLVFDPGSAFNYSFAIDVLGRVVEVASGQTFDRYLDSAIFQPLGMRSTAFHATPDMRRRTTSAFVRGRDGKLVPLSPILSEGYTDAGRMLSGGGGLLSTIPDYLRFAQMLLNGGTLDGRRVLRPETVRLMMTNHLPPALTPILAQSPWPPGKNGFGYGGAVRLDSASVSMPGPAGIFRWTGYGSTFFWIDLQNKLIAMLWSQYLPETQIWAIDGEYQRLVYAALGRASAANDR